MQKYLFYALTGLAILFCHPVLSFADDENTPVNSETVNEVDEFEGLYDPFNEPDDPMFEVVPPDLGLDGSFYKNGFHAAFGLGYQYVPNDSVSSGYHYFNAAAQGGFISIDLGYHWDFFALSFNISPRAAWLMQDAMIQGKRLSYAALNDKDWDGYFLSLGLKMDFIAPLRDDMFMKFGFSLDFPIGVAPTYRSKVEYQFRVGVSTGLYWRVTEKIALGFDVALRGRLRNHTYRNDELILRESFRTTYFEPSIGLIYHP